MADTKKMRGRGPLAEAQQLFRYRRDQAEQAWNTITNKIQSVPNAMNVRGVWQQNQLNDLQFLRIAIGLYDSILFELDEIAKKSTKRKPKKKRVAR